MKHGHDEEQGLGNPPASRRTSAGADVGSMGAGAGPGHLTSEVDDGTQPPRDADSSARDEEHFERFRRSKFFMLHWRNVVEEPRVASGGLILMISFRNGDGVLARQTLRGRGMGRPGTPWADAATNPDVYAGGSSRSAAVSHAIFVRDLSWHLISRLGPAFDLSPEVFEHHLVRSGYQRASYRDPDPSTWPTRFLPQQQVSLRWFSLVTSNGIVPGGARSREWLLSRLGLHWEARSVKQQGRRVGGTTPLISHQQLYATTNIFRQEWPLSAVNRPGRRELRGDDRLGEYVEIVDNPKNRPGVFRPNTQDETAAEESPDIVAWEERVTFCWGHLGPERRRKFANPRSDMHT